MRSDAEDITGFKAVEDYGSAMGEIYESELWDAITGRIATLRSGGVLG